MKIGGIKGTIINRKNVGKVYLVGAGPGDPGLITKRGAELVDTSDVVVLDALVNPSVLRSTRATIYYVGKRGPGAPEGSSLKLSQAGINRLLIRLARQGKRVVRLKGGDPIVFGRGSEEMEALRAARVRYEIVPGVSSPIAVPAFAGIPISDRRWASQVTFLTGQESKERHQNEQHVEWAKLPKKQTLVILMGVSRWRSIQKQLLQGGWPSNKPVTAIQSGTTPQQKVISTTLKKSVLDFKKRNLTSPAIIVVGDVAKLTKKLSWVDQEKPLMGRRIVMTRAESQSARMKRLLHEKGADVIPCPTIDIVPLSGDPKLQSFYTDFLNRRERFDWLVFLSANGVQTFFYGLGRDKEKWPPLKVCAVGPQTAQSLRSLGVRVHRQAKKFNSQGVLKALGSVRGKRILVPRVQGAPKEFIHALRKKGADVKELYTYQNRQAPSPSKGLRRLLLMGVDAITFTSGSTVRHFAAFFRKKTLRTIFSKTMVLSIGPQTSKALRSLGVRKLVQSDRETTARMVEILCHKFAPNR